MRTRIVKLIDVDDDIVRIKYDVTKICNEVGCPGIISTRHLNTSRQLSYFESCRANDDLPDDESVQALMLNYWERRLDICNCTVILAYNLYLFLELLMVIHLCCLLV